MAPISSPEKSRRWTVIASGLLVGALAVVVTFTTRKAFLSPLAIVVVAAIGLAAAMLQLRLRQPSGSQTWHPGVLALNLVGIGCAVVALFADPLRLTPSASHLAALVAVGCFVVSGALMLHRFRHKRAGQK